MHARMMIFKYCILSHVCTQGEQYVQILQVLLFMAYITSASHMRSQVYTWWTEWLCVCLMVILRTKSCESNVVLLYIKNYMIEEERVSYLQHTKLKLTMQSSHNHSAGHSHICTWALILSPAHIKRSCPCCSKTITPIVIISMESMVLYINMISSQATCYLYFIILIALQVGLDNSFISPPIILLLYSHMYIFFLKYLLFFFIFSLLMTKNNKFN